MEIITLYNASKKYSNGVISVDALKNINLSIKQNEFVAIMGPSGSGKSTLMNVLGCLDTLTDGSYTLNGNNVSELTDEALAGIRNKEIGFVFQMFHLLKQYNVIENVSLPLIYAGENESSREEKAIRVLDTVGLKDRVTHKPDELSGGQMQRVAIARALINNPAIILADEPTGNLDSKTTLDILKLFEELHNKGNTIVFITHEDDVALHAHRIITLRDGEITEDKVNPNIVRLT